MTADEQIREHFKERLQRAIEARNNFIKEGYDTTNVKKCIRIYKKMIKEITKQIEGKK